MAASAQPKHSLPRRCFRWVRIAVLTVVLVIAGLVLWANQVGVPEFIASSLRSELRKNNIALTFDRLRLKGFRRIVADRLRIAPMASTNQSQIELAQGELVFRYSGSGGWPFEISGLRLDGGSITLPLNEPSAPARSLLITNVEADVQFLPGDTLRVASLSGEAFGARADLSVVLNHFSKFRLAKTAQGAPQKWQQQVIEVADIAQRLAFRAPPRLTLSFTSDAVDLTQTRASVSLRADEGTSPWGEFRRLRLNSAVAPLTNPVAFQHTFRLDLGGLTADPVQLDQAEIRAEALWSSDMQQLVTNHVSVLAAGLKTPWLSGAKWTGQLLSSREKSGRIASELTLQAPKLETSVGQFVGCSLVATLDHALPFPTPAQWLGGVLSSFPAATNAAFSLQDLSGKWQFHSDRVSLPPATADAFNLTGELLPTGPIPNLTLTPKATSLWHSLAPFQLPWQLQLSNLVAGEARLGTLSTHGRWHFPMVTLEEIKADLYEGKLRADAQLDVTTRAVSASVESLFDYHSASVLLDPPVQKWLEQFHWEAPPAVNAVIGLRLPPWTNAWERLAQQVLPTLTLAGSFEGRGAWREVPLGHINSHFDFTNFVWRLPDLSITRPEGRASVNYVGNVTNLEMSAVIESQIDPAILAAAFDSKVQPAFSFVRFTTPPLLKAELRADLDEPQTLTARGSLAATNFFAKEQGLTGLQTTFAYSNNVITLTDLIVHRGKEEVVAPLAIIDFPAERMFVTNAVSTLDPYIAMSLVGDDAYEAIDPYRFANTPTVTVNGFVPLRHFSKADLYFHVSGTEFSFWRFHFPSLTGDVHWKANELSISNAVASFYNGVANWSGFFLIDPRHEVNAAQFSFTGTARDASLRLLVKDLVGTTNRLEGILNGDLVITSANTADDRSWNGFGKATVKDGYLWSIPIFGVFSSAMDAIAPGFGNNPVTSGAGNFTITNSVVYTRDFQVRAPAYRLNYKGHVDLEGRLDALVEAELLRDTKLFGRLFSAALWPVSKVFEARVSGRLDDPKTKLRYVPEILLAPFKVINAIGEAARRKEPKANPPPASADPVKPQPE